jgi:hypothetical protein
MIIEPDRMFRKHIDKYKNVGCLAATKYLPKKLAISLIFFIMIFNHCGYA